MKTGILEGYKPSGKLAGMSILFALPAVGLIVIVLTFIYALLLNVIPWIYVAVLIFAGFVFALTVTSGLLVEWSKVRNPAFAMALGLLVGLFGLYVSWLLMLPDIVKLLGGSVSGPSLMKDPVKMWDFIQQVAAIGYYSVFTVPVSGFMLWTIWAIEAIGIVFVPVFMAYEQARNNVFCETCNQWAKEEKGIVAFFHSAQENLMELFSQGDPAFMEAAIPVEVPSNDYYKIDTEACEKCSNLHALSLRLMKMDDDGKGFTEQTLYEDLLVGNDYFNKILAFQNRYPAPKEEESDD